MTFDRERLKTLEYWMVEREKIRVAKAEGKPKPWTKDPILQQNRFCSVKRMDDKVSQWLLLNWYGAGFNFDGSINVAQTLANAGMARLINWPDSLAMFIKAGLNSKYNARTAFKVMNEIKSRGKLFTGVYIINGIAGQDKVTTVLDQFSALYKSPHLVNTASMQLTHEYLQQIKGNGSFISGQLVADLRHVLPGTWLDRLTWAPLGPGSRRGIAWLVEDWDGIRDLPAMREALFVEHLNNLWAALAKRKGARTVMEERQLEMHDLQNSLCEIDKYLRISTGTGKARNGYPGTA